MTSLIKKSCKKMRLPELTFYEAGRHTFASQWVLTAAPSKSCERSSVTRLCSRPSDTPT
jgi:hypothetical protein